VGDEKGREGGSHRQGSARMQGGKQTGDGEGGGVSMKNVTCIMTMEVLDTDFKASRSMVHEMSVTSSSPRYSFT